MSTLVWLQSFSHVVALTYDPTMQDMLHSIKERNELDHLSIVPYSQIVELGQFDLVVIDADHNMYQSYVELIRRFIPHGTILIQFPNPIPKSQVASANAIGDPLTFGLEITV
jgi:predicted O-methyltransferase YrrM